MTFSYFDYLISNLVLPVFALAFIAFPVCRLVIQVIRQVKNSESVSFGEASTVLVFILMLVVAVILGNILFRSGGFYLITERPGDAVTTQGTIEEIQPLGIFESPKYMSNGESSNGYAITIDGISCTTMAQGMLEVGDEVAVTYLPNSGFVLSIEAANP